MATCRGSLSPDGFSTLEALELKDLFLFCFVDVVDLLDVLVGDFLDLILSFKGVVLGNIAVLFEPLDQLVGIPTDIANRDLVFFAISVGIPTS